MDRAKKGIAIKDQVHVNPRSPRVIVESKGKGKEKAPKELSDQEMDDDWGSWLDLDEGWYQESSVAFGEGCSRSISATGVLSSHLVSHEDGDFNPARCSFLQKNLEVKGRCWGDISSEEDTRDQDREV